MKMNLIELFDQLDYSRDSSYNAVKIPESEHLLGRNDRGYPVILLKTQSTKRTFASVDLDLLHASFNSRWVVRVEERVVEDVFSMLYLDAEDVVLQKYFLEVMEIVLRKFPQNPTVEDLHSCVMDLIQIFLAKQKAPRKEAQGLWAELAIIYLSKSPEALLSAWHSDTDSKVDFVCGSEMIEVKSTRSGDRRHHFSSGQLTPEKGIREIIASMIVRESGEGKDGLSIEDLRLAIHKQIESDSLRMKLFDVIMNTLGSAYDHATTMFFNLAEARQSLKFYEIDEIPHVEKKNIPAGVTELEYVVDLNGCRDFSVKMPSFDLKECMLLGLIGY